MVLPTLLSTDKATDGEGILAFVADGRERVEEDAAALAGLLRSTFRSADRPARARLLLA